MLRGGVARLSRGDEGAAVPSGAATFREKRDLIRQCAREGRPVFLPTVGDSMWPLLQAGDRVGVVPVRPDDLSSGDLFAYDEDGATICHRFLGWVTRGDARLVRQQGDNISEGGLVPEASVLGRVAVLDLGGRIVDLDAVGPRLIQRLIGVHLRMTDLLLPAPLARGRVLAAVRRRAQRLLVRPLDRLTRRL